MLDSAQGALRRFGAKARCRYSQRAAKQAWNKLEPFLDESDRFALLIAWEHIVNGEGPRELDLICQRLATLLS